MAVVVVQRHPGYWTWFVSTLHARMGGIAALLAVVARAGVLPPVWTSLVADLAALLAAGAVHFASTAQPPRVQLTPEEVAKLIAAQAKNAPAPASQDPAPTPPADLIVGKSILFIPILFLLVGSCGPRGQQVATDVKACAEANAQAAISNLYPTVTAIVTSEAGDWETQLGALGKEFGPFLICTLIDVYHDLKTKMPLAPVKGEIDPRLVRGVTRSSVYLRAHGVTP